MRAQLTERPGAHPYDQDDFSDTHTKHLRKNHENSAQRRAAGGKGLQATSCRPNFCFVNHTFLRRPEGLSDLCLGPKVSTKSLVGLQLPPLKRASLHHPLCDREEGFVERKSLRVFLKEEKQGRGQALVATVFCH
jgi:hypothetical protein